MDNSKTICPICTLYLREGVTLQAHLNTHPKDQVIEALLKVSNGGSTEQVSHTPTPTTTSNSTSTSTSTSTSYGPMQSFTNSNSSFISQASPYSNPQTQMTTAVTYQHFMTSNGSAIMPQYIQVPTIINPNTNIPVLSQDFAPNQTMNYSQTMYNPLYNPYIPHPYPFTQPVYTSFPITALPAVDPNTQNNQNSTSTTTVGNGEAGTLPQPSVLVKKCTVATSTEMDKRNLKNCGSKKINSKNTAVFKKVKSLKQKTNDSSNSRIIIKPALKNSTGNAVRFGLPKKSVIRILRPKISTDPSSSTKSGIISPPPLTPITGAPKRSLSGSKTPPPPPLSKAPCFASTEILTFVKSENITDCTETESVTEITNEPSSSASDSASCLEQDQKPSTVIVDSSTLIQNSNNEISDNNENNNFEIQSIRSLLEKSESEVEKKNEIQSSEESLRSEIEEINISNNLRGLNDEEDNSEKQEKVFHILEIEEESKIDIIDMTMNEDNLKEINKENIERNNNSSDLLIQEENICLNEDKEKEKQNDVNSNHETSEADNKNSPCDNQSLTEFSFYNKELNDTIEKEVLKEDSLSKTPDLQPITYTDLQPAKSSRVFQDLGLSTSINFNNFVEVDGIKIIFNNSASAVPYDPLLKLTTGIQTDGRNITAFMKTENPVTNHALVDSVIQLVSGNAESKNDMTFKDSYPPTTSHINDIQLDIQNLSPLALNIQADESMPARGELSEQESLGAENSTWNLFHGNSASNAKAVEEWKNDSSQSVSIIGSKKGEKAFKCSNCNEVFSCPKERRVHKNTIHLNNRNDKNLSSSKKPKSYNCNFCSDVFSTLRDRKVHISQHHQTDTKCKKNSLIKEENAEPECINLDETKASVKNETEEQNVKTETIPSAEGESHRVKYCARCSLPFAGVKKLREHLRLVHGEIRFKCETCSACFDEEHEYNDHLIIHPLICDKCGKKFHKKPNLNLHMKRHLDVKPYECTLCPKSFITRQKLEEHMNGHSGKKPLKCTLCDKTFSRHSNLIQHRNLHHLNVKKKVKDFVCRCGEVFHSLRKLEWHKEVHEPKPKPCPFCSQKFIHSASVTRHIRRAHLPDYLPGDNREYDNVQCPICEKVYLRSSLVVHMRVHNGEKPFACKICNKRFSTKWNLELHSWTHQSRSNMPFKCQICKSAFFRETDFVAHLNSHRNYKPFTCNICGQKFIRKYSCLRHQEEHKKSKQFVCAVSGCAKSFHRGYYLRDHMKVHTGVRPHTCHICGKASSTKSNHNKHIRIHDTREPVNTEN